MAKVNSVDKCLQILEELAVQREGVGVRELSRRLGVFPSGVHNILQTMVQRGFLQQDQDSKRFKLGIKLLRLGQSGTVKETMAQAAQPIMVRLVETVGETALLALLEDGHILPIKTVNSLKLLRVDETQWHGGHHATAYGKVLLAAMNEETLTLYLEQYPLEAFTGKTLCSEPALRAQLDLVRKQGYAQTEDEGVEGVSAIAVPLRDNKGQIIAALGVSAPTLRFVAGKRLDALEVLRHGADEIVKKWLG